MNEKFFHINRNKLELKLLYILFFVSAFSVFISILLIGIFNLKITFYEYSYFLTVIISVYIFFNNYIFSLRLNRLIFNLLFYFFLISIPITYFTGSLISSFIFFKNFLIFIPLTILYNIIFKKIESIIPFIKIIILSGVFFSFYIIFEFSNNIFQFIPQFKFWIGEYLTLSGRSEYSEFINTDSFDILSLIRPIGFDVNFTSGAFFICSSLIFLLISGDRFTNKKRIKYFSYILLYIALILSSSRQIVIFFHIGIFIFVISSILNKNNVSKFLSDSIIKNFLFFIFSVSIIILIIFTSYYSLINNLIDIQNLSGTGTVGLIIMDLANLYTNLEYFLINYPFNFFFGIGTYTPDYPGLYYMLPHIKELHFFTSTFYTFGLFGFIIFWGLFLKSLRKFYVVSFDSSFTKYSDLYLSILIITFIFLLCIIHYPPIGLSTNFIIALIPYFYVKSLKLQ